MDMSPETCGIGMCIDMCVDVERLRTELRNAKDLAETLGPKLVRCQIIDARFHFYVYQRWLIVSVAGRD